MNLRELFLYKNFGPQGSGGGDGSGVTIKNQNKTFTENGTYKADSGYTGLGTVTVNVPETEPVLETLAVTENGEYTPGSGVDGFSKVTVNVETRGGGYSIEDIAQLDKIAVENITLEGLSLRPYAFYGLTGVKTVTLKENTLTPVETRRNLWLFSASSVEDAEILMTSDTAYPHNGAWGQLFKNCKSLKKATGHAFIPQYESFSGCSALECIDFLKIHGGNTYQNCSNLKTIILRSDTLQALATNNTSWDFSLNGTPFDPDNTSATGGFILVPSALVSEYQAATNWVTLYEVGLCTFLPLEEYTVDGTTTGEIDWDKLNAVVYPE